MTDASSIDLALAVIRLTLGSVMLAHGINHVFRGGKIAGTAGWFESLGMRPGRLHAWLASLTEIVAGVMLLVGLLVPLAAAATLGVMLVAWIVNHRGNGFFTFRPGEGWEYVMTLSAVSFAMAILGGGRWSLDHLFDLDGLAGTTGLVIALVVGVGGTAALLAVCWRPPKESA
jgi:putative oxidoreductase